MNNLYYAAYNECREENHQMLIQNVIQNYIKYLFEK